MRIGNVDLGEKPLLLAPMEDVTDIGFRLLCRRMGAAMVYSEFVSCDALVRMVNRSLENWQSVPKSVLWQCRFTARTVRQWLRRHVLWWSRHIPMCSTSTSAVR